MFLIALIVVVPFLLRVVFFFFLGAEIAFFAIFYGYYYVLCDVFALYSFLASNGRAWRQRVVR
jgi:hypothetical protein